MNRSWHEGKYSLNYLIGYFTESLFGIFVLWQPTKNNYSLYFLLSDWLLEMQKYVVGYMFIFIKPFIKRDSFEKLAAEFEGILELFSFSVYGEFDNGPVMTKPLSLFSKVTVYTVAADWKTKTA